MKISFCKQFAQLDDEKSAVFEVMPDVHSDVRGCFSEVVKAQGFWPKGEMPLWFASTDWIRQVNRSVSSPGTVRGCHAQKAPCCQGKLVEAVTEKVYDIITDARPESPTFGTTSAFLLDSTTQNKLWVPRGFLHSFVVPFIVGNTVFQYFCDGTYSKEHEVGVSPLTLLPKAVEELKALKNEELDKKFADLYDVFDKKLSLSYKDLAAPNYEEWMGKMLNEYLTTKKIWYKDWK